MKTFKAKSSVKRAVVKTIGLEAFNAGEVAKSKNGEWMFIPAAPAIEEIEKNIVSIEINQSTIAKPCNLVWEIAIEMSGAVHESGIAPKRSEVIAKCVEAGVAYNTARTQYQAWFKATKGAN
jgi:hypothetical protein